MIVQTYLRDEAVTLEVEGKADIAELIVRLGWTITNAEHIVEITDEERRLLKQIEEAGASCPNRSTLEARQWWNERKVA